MSRAIAQAAAGDEARARPSGGLRRALGPIDATAIVVGSIIGVGIFFTPSRVAALAGSAPAALAAWTAGGVIALLGALTFAALGRLYPRTGGQYDVLRDAWGPLAGFLYVVCNATAIQAGAIAIIALVCARHLAVALAMPPLTGTPLALVAALLVGGLVLANAAGVRWGARIQNLTVLAKLAALGALVALAALTAPLDPSAAAASAAPAGAATGSPLLFLAAIVPTLFSFGGWQQALWMAGEVRDAERNVPRAIVVGVVLVVVVYLATNGAYLATLGFAGLVASPTPAAAAVATRWPEAAGRAVAAAVALSAYGVLNAQLLGGPRLIYALARDGRFFAPFARAHARFATPVAAIALLGGTALALLFAAGERAVDRLLTGVVLIDAVFFALTGAALLHLARRQGSGGGVPRVAHHERWAARLFVAAEILVCIGAWGDASVRGAAWVGVAWIVAAALVYALWFRGARRPVAPTEGGA